MIKFSKHSKSHNQNGFAIITVIFVLALISLSGIMVIQTTNNELQISTNDQINKISFYAAEAAKTYVIFNPDLYGSANIDPTTSVSFPEKDDPSVTQTLLTDSNQSFGGTVEYVSSALPPRGLGYQAGKFRAHRYRMTCTGFGPRNSQAWIESGFYRIGF